MRLLVTGTQGQVVTALRTLSVGEGVDVVALGRPDLDLAAPQGLDALLARINPDVVVSAAAYTAVDQAEAEPDIALAVNGTGPGLLSAACAARGLPILQISTDFVFDGAKSTPYTESDAPAPLSSYGRSKLAGERAVAAANPRHIILRTAWVYSARGRNFLNTMLGAAQTRPDVFVVADQFGCPTFADDIAMGIFTLARQVNGLAAQDARFGTYHMAGTGDTSWAGFAEAIFAHAAHAGHPVARVNPITTPEYPLPATRPANSRLDCRRLQATFGVKLPLWSESLARCLDSLFKST